VTKSGFNNNSFQFDQLTGMVAPSSPFSTALEQLPPDDPKTLQYTAELREFLKRRQQIEILRSQFNEGVGERVRLQLMTAANASAADYYAAKIAKWNGDIFWSPASKSTDINLQFGDEARAVFGPIPAFDVTTIGKTNLPDGSTMLTGVLYSEVNGYRIELKPNTSKTR
jgi:hypothetical protein